jgi:hypothetical protein
MSKQARRAGFHGSDGRAALAGEPHDPLRQLFDLFLHGPEYEGRAARNRSRALAFLS